MSVPSLALDSPAHDRSPEPDFGSALSGGAEAFGPVVAHFQDPLIGYIAKIVKNREEAEEIAQDVFLRTFRHRKKLAKNGQCKGWIFRVATNLAIDSLRKKQRRPLVALDDEGAVPASSKEQGSEKLIREQQAAILEDALKELSPDIRSMIRLYYEEELSHREIARQFGKSPGAIRVILHRAKKKLATLIRKREEDSP